MIQRSPVIREGSLRFDDDLERGGEGRAGEERGVSRIVNYDDCLGYR